MFSHCFAMYFALVCIIGMLKFTAKRANTRSHNHPTCTWLHLIGNDEVKSFYQTMLLRPCPTWSLMVHFFCMSFHFLLFYFFTTVNNWLRESTITFKYAQQATTTAHAFISSFCCDIFFTFLNFWANFSRLWHTGHCKKRKLPAGRHNHIDGKPQQQSDDNINFFLKNFLSL